VTLVLECVDYDVVASAAMATATATALVTECARIGAELIVT